VQKDVEHAFRVLLSRFAIIANLCRLWNMNTMKDFMNACIILYNMIIEDESSKEHLEPLFQSGTPVQLKRGLNFENLVAETAQLENIDSHYSLRGDLDEHL
jgi:hypothetical protein